MLIKLDYLVKKYNVNINGIIHVGAHECEELIKYNSQNILNENIYWVEGQISKVNKMKEKGIQNIYHAIIDEKDKEPVTLNISNNGQSSSILHFGSHLRHHPEVHYVSKLNTETIRLDTLINEQKIPIQKINFLNLDIQGVELRALKSLGNYLKHIDYIYTEINTEDVYLNCDQINKIDEYLNKHGFKRVETKMYKQCGWGDAFYIKK